jgi:hypothetical protein
MNAQAACLGSKHVLLTPGSKEECQEKVADKVRQRGRPSAVQTIASDLNLVELPKVKIKQMGYGKIHILRIDWSIYHLPSEPGYTRQFTSHFAPTGLNYHYYINPSWSVGVKYQAYSLEGHGFTDDNDIVKFGSDNLDVMRLWAFGAFHFDITTEYEFYVMGGVPIMESSKPSLAGEDQDEVSGAEPFLFEFGIGKLVGENIAYGGIRFVDSASDTEKILEYHNTGGAEMFIGISLGLF